MLGLQPKDTKWVYYKFTNPQTGKVMQDVISHDAWQDIQRDSIRRQHFEFIREIDLADSNVEADTTSSPVPIIEDTLECPICGYVAIDDKELKKHKQEKHG